MPAPVSRNTVEGYLRDLQVRLTRLERHTHAGGGGGTAGPPGPGWPIVVKATPPTAADYGEATIPIDAVWIQKAP
jgi:hypothetical protein